MKFADACGNEVSDALTGGHIVGQIYKCQECSCRYGKESVNILIEQCDGRCIGCDKTAILLE